MSAIERMYFSFGELAEQWGVSLWTIRRLVERGELKAINIGVLARIPRTRSKGQSSLAWELPGLGRQEIIKQTPNDTERNHFPIVQKLSARFRRDPTRRRRAVARCQPNFFFHSINHCARR